MRLLTFCVAVLLSTCSPLHAATLVQGRGFAVTTEMVDAELALLPPQLATRIRADPSRLEETINDLYKQKALAEMASAEHLDHDPEVQYRLQRAEERELVGILIERQTEIAATKLPDLTARAKEVYWANPDKYTTPEMVRVRHILLKAKTPEEKQARRAEAQSILQRLQGGEDFGDLAKEFSEDRGSARSGGDLGFLRRGATVKQFEDAAFVLKKPGDVSGIVETPFGLHIIYLEARKKAERRSFDEVKNAIAAKIRKELIRDAVASWEASVTDPKNAKINEEAVKKYIKHDREGSDSLTHSP